MKAAREDWFEGQLDLDPERLGFLDETGTSTKMARRYGRAPRGERCRMPVPLGNYKTTTVTAALRASGISAVSLLDTTMNGKRFLSYVEQTLVPELKPGDTVILDNLPAHKVAGVRTFIEAAGRTCSTSRPIRRTSIRSRTSSPSSKRCCAPPQREPSRTSGLPSGGPSKP